MELEPQTRNIRSAPLKILNRQAVENAFRISDVDWKMTVDPGALWMPQGLVNIRFLPSYTSFTEHQKLRYNQLYALAIAEQFIWFEEAIVIPIMRTLLKDPVISSDLRECLEHFISDEERHAEMFRRLLLKADPASDGKYKFYNLTGAQRHFYNAIVKNPNFFIAWIWMTIYFEERTMHISRLYREEKLDPLFTRCHLLHMIDESRHLQVDQYLLTHFYDTQPAWKKSVSAWMYKKVIAAYAAPKRISARVLEMLADEFPSEREKILSLVKEFPLLPQNREFMTAMFGDQAIPRTRHLLARYPEMHPSLAVIS